MRNRKQPVHPSAPSAPDYDPSDRFESRASASDDHARRGHSSDIPEWCEGRASLSGLERQYEPNERSGPGWAADSAFDEGEYMGRASPRSPSGYDPTGRRFDGSERGPSGPGDADYGPNYGPSGAHWGRGGALWDGAHDRSQSPFYERERALARGREDWNRGYAAGSNRGQNHGTIDYRSSGYATGNARPDGSGPTSYGGFDSQGMRPESSRMRGHMSFDGASVSRGGFGVVSGPVRKFRGPKGYTRSDDRIREDVCDLLGNLDDVDPTDVEVTVREGEVTLTGTVTERRFKHFIEDVTERVSGVTDVHNQIRVKRIGMTDSSPTMKAEPGGKPLSPPRKDHQTS